MTSPAMLYGIHGGSGEKVVTGPGDSAGVGVVG
jgi:hypothetical protein